MKTFTPNSYNFFSPFSTLFVHHFTLEKMVCEFCLNMLERSDMKSYCQCKTLIRGAFDALDISNWLLYLEKKIE